jgi:hypothetical protein
VLLGHQKRTFSSELGPIIDKFLRRNMEALQGGMPVPGTPEDGLALGGMAGYSTYEGTGEPADLATVLRCLNKLFLR